MGGDLDASRRPAARSAVTQKNPPACVTRVSAGLSNVSSVTAVMGGPTEAAYGAAKSGLHGLTRSLARETAPDGISVNCVVPGVFETEMTLSMPELTQQAVLRMIPVGRRGDPDELARAVTFLLDDDAGYVTGS
jgi:acetoacetyl-CoA reductase/3-oxoacyl-[acyl-carrier protein] reductase